MSYQTGSHTPWRNTYMFVGFCQYNEDDEEEDSNLRKLVNSATCLSHKCGVYVSRHGRQWVVSVVSPLRRFVNARSCRSDFLT